MRNIKKILTTILSISLLFATSCISPSIPQETKGKDTIIININSDNAYEDKNLPAGEYVGSYLPLEDGKLAGYKSYKSTVEIGYSSKIKGQAYGKKQSSDTHTKIDFEITVGGWMGKDNSYSAINATTIIPQNMKNTEVTWNCKVDETEYYLLVKFDNGLSGNEKESYFFYGTNIIKK